MGVIADLRYVQRLIVRYFSILGLALIMIVPANSQVAGPVMSYVAPRQSGTTDPVLRRFDHAITFYLSFNQSPWMADLSAGDGRLRDPKVKFVLKDGLTGRSVLIRKQQLYYRAEGNVDLSKPGSALVWIKPSQVDHCKRRPCYLNYLRIQDRGRLVAVAQMSRGSRVKNYAYAQVRLGEKKYVGVVHASASAPWRGRWHLFVINWEADAIQLSIDGGPLERADAPWLTSAEGKRGYIAVGAPHYMMDDLMILNMPLTMKEIEWAYRQR